MDSLDLLVSENELISLAFACWSVEPTKDATQHGMEAKFIIRHLAIREAAREDAKHAFLSMDQSQNLLAFINSERRPMREAIFEATRMTAGVEASELNVGQAFDQAMEHARVTFESDWDDRFDVLCEQARVADHLRLHSADYIFYRSPVRLSPSGPHWYERIGAIRLVRAGYDALRRSPTVQRRYLPESLQSAERVMFAHLER
jgi:hypothetical protein